MFFYFKRGVLFCICMLIAACNESSDFKEGFLAMSIDNDRILDEIKNELKQQNIEYHIYVDKETKTRFIEYPPDKKYQFDSIVAKIYGTPPPGYMGNCYSIKEPQIKLDVLFKANHISYIVLDNQHGHCIYWLKNHNAIVKTLNID